MPYLPGGSAPHADEAVSRDRPGLDGRILDLELSLGLARRALLLIRGLSAGDRPDWRAVCGLAQDCLERLDAFADLADAPPERRPLAALMRAQVYRARDTLQEATPERLRGFGNLSPELQRDLDRHLDQLQAALAVVETALDRLPRAQA